MRALTIFIMSSLPFAVWAQGADSSRPHNLKMVTVNGNKPLVTQEADRISYNLQADPDSKSNNVLEIMRKVPYLSVDANNNLMLNGSTGFKILVNGKPSSVMERNAKEVLRSMPASGIQRIEVITIPPSKYDAEGQGGIINIITQQRKDNGYNGTLNINGKFPQGGPGIGGTLSARQGKFGISAFGGASIYNTPRTISRNQRTTFKQPTILSQDGAGSSDSRSGYLGAELSYEADSLQLISAQFNINGSRSEDQEQQRSVLGAGTEILQDYSLNAEGNGRGKGMDASLNYQLGFRADKGRLLTVSYRYLHYDNGQDKTILIDNFGSGAKLTSNRQLNNSSASEQTIQLDYIQQKKQLSFEAGVKGIFRSNNSDYQYLLPAPAGGGQWEQQPAAGDGFRNKQYILGVYNTWQYQLKMWSFKAGARIEHTITEAEFLSTHTGTDQHYFNLIPAVAVLRKFPNRNSLNLGFSQRIKRPGINKLNPFVDRSNPNAEVSGNPGLRPSIMNNLLLGYNTAGKLAVNAGLGYSFFRNLDLRITSFNPETNITATTFANVGKGAAIIGNLNINYPFTGQWNAALNSNLVYINMDGPSGNTLIKVNRVMYNVNLSSAYRFQQSWRCSVSLTAAGPGIASLQSLSNGLFSSTFSISKDLLADRLSLAAGISNPFSQYRHNIVSTSDADFMGINDTREYFRSCNFSLNYRFGKLKEGIRKTRRGINNDDVSNSKGGL